MDTIVQETKAIKPPVLRSAVEAPIEELSAEKAENRYLELLRGQADKIKKEVLETHGISNLEEALPERRGPVILELKRRIIDLLAEEEEKMLSVNMEGKHSPQFNQFIDETLSWYEKLDRLQKLDMFAFFHGGGKSNSERITQAKPENQKMETTVTPEQKKALFMERTHALVPKSDFLAGAMNGFAEVLQPQAEKVGKKPSLVEVKEGQSLYDLLKDALADDSKFVPLNPARREYVLSALAGKIMGNPSAYGLPENGDIVAGDKVEASKLPVGEAELDKLVEKALRLSEAQMQRILGQHQLIKNWLAAHPNEILDESKVSEILSAKEVPETEEISNKPKPAETVPRAMPEVREVSEPPKQTVSNALPQSRSMRGDFLDHQKVEAAFKEDINGIYGKSYLLGLSKTEGVKSAEWSSVRSLPAKKFMEFFTRNSEESDLPAKLKEVLNSVPQHRNMALHLSELMKLAEGSVRPYDNENLEAFIRRLGGFVMSQPSQPIERKELPRAV